MVETRRNQRSFYYQTTFLVQTFISCRLDYCNSLFYGITEGLMSQLQSVQNAASRLVSGARLYDHIIMVVTSSARHQTWSVHVMPVLRELHWLPVRRRLYFKMVTIVYLSLSDMTPAYLAADCQLVSDEGSHQLRSATSTSRTFAAAGPKLWRGAFQLKCDWLTLVFNVLSGY